MIDYKCPKCNVTDMEGWFNVSGRATFVVDSDGVEDYHNVEWDDEAPMNCRTCGHSGIVADFTNTEEATA